MNLLLKVRSCFWHSSHVFEQLYRISEVVLRYTKIQQGEQWVWAHKRRLLFPFCVLFKIISAASFNISVKELSELQPLSCVWVTSTITWCVVLERRDNEERKTKWQLELQKIARVCMFSCGFNSKAKPIYCLSCASRILYHI